jgi:hypothetical protein
MHLQVGKGMPKKYGIEGDLREALYRWVSWVAALLWSCLEAGTMDAAVMQQVHQT